MNKLLTSLRLVLPLAGALGLGLGTAHATTVTFGTTGSFNGSASTLNNSVSFGSGGNTLTVQYQGLAAGTTVNASPVSFSNLGAFQVTTAGTGASIAAGTTFALTVNQTVPSAGSGTLSATLAGTLAQNSSTGLVTFAATSLSLGGITYTISNNPLPLVPPSTNGGVTTIQASISAVPEPATLSMMGLGLLGLGVIGRKRKV